MIAKLPLAIARARLPDPANAFIEAPESDRHYIREMNAACRREFERRGTKDEALGEVLLVSPNGTTYAVTVSDVGALVVTLKYQPV
jgi:hypothetical protein